MARGTPSIRQAVLMEPRWIDTPEALSACIEELVTQPRYALDTEFHGEKSYWPRLALIQIAWPGNVVLVDPLAVNPAPLEAVLAGPGTMVAHAADQDLGILERACGRSPTHLFDTQVAAGFIGMGTPSLAAEVERLLGQRLTKGDRLTDWTRRPLRVEQRAYAAADVDHLLALHDTLTEKLEASGRLQWAVDECEERRKRVRSRPDPETAWWRIKGARQLRGTTRGVAQAVAAWRERSAESLDVPPRYVLSDLALAGIVQRPPHNREELTGIRGLDGRLRDSLANELLDVVASGLDRDPKNVRMPDPERVDRSLAPAVTVLGAWLAQRASELDLDPALLATRAELAQLLQGEPSRLGTGWRAELVGESLHKLLKGEVSLVLADGGRRIELR